VSSGSTQGAGSAVTAGEVPQHKVVSGRHSNTRKHAYWSRSGCPAGIDVGACSVAVAAQCGVSGVIFLREFGAYHFCLHDHVSLAAAPHKANN
jgi:hypothetical protein